jgi:peptidoglycan hydrolase CwlO-like protein
MSINLVADLIGEVETLAQHLEKTVEGDLDAAFHLSELKDKVHTAKMALSKLFPDAFHAPAPAPASIAKEKAPGEASSAASTGASSAAADASGSAGGAAQGAVS